MGQRQSDSNFSPWLHGDGKYTRSVSGRWAASQRVLPRTEAKSSGIDGESGVECGTHPRFPPWPPDLGLGRSGPPHRRSAGLLAVKPPDPVGRMHYKQFRVRYFLHFLTFAGTFCLVRTGLVISVYRRDPEGNRDSACPVQKCRARSDSSSVEISRISKGGLMKLHGLFRPAPEWLTVTSDPENCGSQTTWGGQLSQFWASVYILVLPFPFRLLAHPPRQSMGS